MEEIKRVLKQLNEGHVCAYVPSREIATIFDKKLEKEVEELGILVFSDLRDNELIGCVDSKIVRPLLNFSGVEVDIYGITDKGRDYLNS